ncbi:MAG: uroporphyrinogen-III synthase, partial [Paracoccaceae bacterium]|nr:uroporphyrinogen-III synthase [Paracoccaceae bacterium]
MTNNILPQRPTLLLTRPQKDAQAFAQEVLSHQPAAQILISPVLTITPIGTLPDLSAYAAVVFTSRHAVACFAHAHIPKEIICFAVGEATAEAAKKLGFLVINSAGAAQNLILLVQKTGAAGPLIHPHGQHARGQIATTLTKKGIPCAECVIYDQIETPLSIQARALLTQPQALLVPVFSPRSARLLQRYGPLPNGSEIIAISQTVAACFSTQPHIKTTVACHPNRGAMLKAVLRRFQDMMLIDPTI